MVRWIARPAPGKSHDFAEHQLDLGIAIAPVEDRSHEPMAAIADLALAAMFVRHVCRPIEAVGKGRRLRCLDGELALLFRGQAHLPACRHMQARPLVEQRPRAIRRSIPPPMTSTSPDISRKPSPHPAPSPIRRPRKLQHAEGDAARLGNGGHYGVTLGETGAKVLDMVLHGWGSGQRAAAS